MSDGTNLHSTFYDSRRKRETDRECQRERDRERQTERDDGHAANLCALVPTTTNSLNYHTKQNQITFAYELGNVLGMSSYNIIGIFIELCH